MKNILSLESVVDWLGQQKPKKKYKYSDSCSCALYQYYAHVGLPIQKMFSQTWVDTSDHFHFLDLEINFIVAEEPHTFGAAYERGLATIERNKSMPRLIGEVAA